MRLLNGRLAVAAGVVLTVAGILAFSLLAPGATLGEETDVGLPTDVGAPSEPPASIPDDTATGPDATGPSEAPPAASLPDTGSGPATDSSGSSLLLLAGLLSAAGIAMTGTGFVAARQSRRAGR